MSATKCELCGARFDVPGAVGNLDQHMASFHPAKATAAQLKKAEKADTEPTAPPAPDAEQPLDEMTNAELSALADQMSLDVGKRPTKADLIEAIEEARAAG